ncbi:unnamed protein product [Auanema sp. JU1783]|nr:unnamed protein product [Auanema sp. JU1783]
MTGTQRDLEASKGGFKFAWPFPKKRTALYKMKSLLTMGFVSSVSRIMFLGGNKLIVHKKERFLKQLEDTSRPLITISNHRSNIDDPLMWAMISFPELLRNLNRNRYTLAAHNICFSKQWHTNIFSLGRCVPCVRGEGVYQPGMNFSVDMLNENGWVHIFPEGRVTADPIRFKWGVGRLVMDSIAPPIIVPIWCQNMQNVWPVYPPYYPRFGHTVEVHVGEPIDTHEMRTAGAHEGIHRRKYITDQLQTALFDLGERVGHVEKGTSLKLLRENKD